MVQQSVEWFLYHLPSPFHSLFFFLPVFHHCDGCLEWGLNPGLQGFASHGAVFYLGAGMARHSGSP